MMLSGLLSILAVGFWAMSGGDARALKRSVKYDHICSRSTPCGWEAYDPYDRSVITFLTSPCECPSNTRCVRGYDDLRYSAYVYRCRPLNEEDFI